MNIMSVSVCLSAKTVRGYTNSLLRWKGFVEYNGGDDVKDGQMHEEVNRGTTDDAVERYMKVDCEVMHI